LHIPPVIVIPANEWTTMRYTHNMHKSDEKYKILDNKIRKSWILKTGIAER